MEEDLNENDLEERLYAMLHYVDETQANVKGNTNEEDVLRIVENAPRSTLRRYWNTNADVNTPNLKVNTFKENPPTNNNNVTNADTVTKSDEKESKQNSTKRVDLSVFQSPVPKDVKKTIEILENDDSAQVVELNSSDEDEVIEVALPPKPTITIESSDDEELKIISKKHSPTKEANTVQINGKPSSRERDVSASPVPSVVSSVSDEFIRGDCIALNISSKRPDNHSFDFSLHGSDLIDQRTPSKKKKKKRSKERVTSTPIDSASTQDKSTTKITDECFATPKSKAKNKRQKNKSSLVSEKIIPSVDIYDSDSNNSMDTSKKRNSYIVTEKSIPSSDVYESDSSQSETLKEITSNKVNEVSKGTPPNTTQYIDISETLSPSTPKNRTATPVLQNNVSTPNLSNNYITIDETGIDENIVMANVTGFTESEDYGDEIINSDVGKEVPKLGSTNVPAILFEDLDFDNLKGNSKVCRRRKYSLTALRAEMEKFYNDSWGGENFNHREIQKYMSRDKSLWVIDPKDRMPSQYKKKSVSSCNYCNRPGHRDDMCQLKPPVCYMCGSTGHYEPRCPRKICVNCGSPNYMYSKMCRNCSMWGRIKCAECGQCGHPSSHCPDIWRRYHNSIDASMPLEENRQYKKHHQLFCSGCTRRGHLVHTCRISLPFSGLPINSPYVHIYAPVYQPTHENISENEIQQVYENRQSKFPNQEFMHRNERHKRQSKSPTVHESHVNKKRNVSTESIEERYNTKSPVSVQQRKLSMSKETDETIAESNEIAGDAEKAPDFIPLNSSNHDKMGQVIQDNEVSDSSDVVTSARIYLTKEVLDKLKNEEGEKWLSEMMKKHNIIVEHMDMNLFISVKGKVGDQETFQNELRNWSKEKSKKENAKSNCDIDISLEADVETPVTNVPNIPKNRYNLLRKLNKALESLKEDIGDPNALYKELMYLQNHHQELLKQKVISPKRLSNNRDNINNMLTKLNMILLGQAGLADGPEHLNELYSIQKKLTSFRQKHVSATLRKEIGDHYHSIFTAIPRDDYVDLLNKYYISKQRPAINKNKFRLTKMVQKKNYNSIPPQPKNFNKGNRNQAAHLIKNIPQVKTRLVEKAMNKLTFYHKRILHSQPADTVLRKTRSELVRRLRSRIQHLESNPSLSSKSLKKMKKIQDQAQLFLTNV